MVNVWWLAIDRNEGHASFEELKIRGVIAQGWPDLGDMTRFLEENRTVEPAIVKNRLSARLRKAYPGTQPSQKLLDGLYNFFLSIRPNDLVVAIEGYEVRGICELPEGSSYLYEAESPGGREQNYAHGRGPVTWISWEEFSPDWTPAVAGRTKAVAGLQSGREEVLRRFNSDGWQETAHLLSSPKNAERLIRSVRQAEIGEARPRTLVPVKDEAGG